MTYLSLFSGIGGFDLGLDRAGLECIGQVECDKAALSVLAHRWPNVQRFEDVRKFNARSIAVRPDLICGGFPCQDISVAGRRAGLAGERSGLFFEFVRIIAAFTPAWVLIENVPGLLSSDGGRDMGTVIGRLADLGYGWSYRVLDAQWFGLAQQRRRVFIVGCAGADVRRAAEVLFERESLPWDPPPSRQAGARTAGSISASAGSGGLGGVGCSRSAITSRITECVGPLQAHSQRHGHAMTTQQAAESGHLIAHALTSEGHDASEDSTGRGTPIVPVVAFSDLRGRQNDAVYGNIAGTLHAAKGQSEVQAVAFAQNQRDEVREMAVAGALASEPGMKQQTYVNRGGVRRLTPKECCRLQGFPDDWLDGLGLSDSAKYRLLGNAVAVPVAEWIGKRLIRHCSERAAR